MSSEFVNPDYDPVTASCKNVSGVSSSKLTYVLVIVAAILFIVVLFNMYGDTISGYFQGALPDRSDVGADKFDLQKEVSYLAEKQQTNLGQK
jgi:predicted PurR-regulated permease PerM